MLDGPSVKGRLTTLESLWTELTTTRTIWGTMSRLSPSNNTPVAAYQDLSETYRIESKNNQIYPSNVETKRSDNTKHSSSLHMCRDR